MYNYMDIVELDDIDFDQIVKTHENNQLDIDEVNVDVPELVINLDEDVLDYDVVYSYPYFSDKNHDYQFCLTIKNNTYELEEIKAEESDISDNNLKVLKSYGEREIKHLLNCVNNSIDIRNDKKLNKIKGGMVDFDLDPSDSVLLKQKIETNKELVLQELYEQILEANN